MKRLLVLPLFFFSLTEAFDQNIPELVVDTSPAGDVSTTSSGIF